MGKLIANGKLYGVRCALKNSINFKNNNKMKKETEAQENTAQCAIQSVMCRALTDIELNGNYLKDGDVVAQECEMVSDYTGKVSIELNRLLIQYNKRNGKWDVKCIDACAGHKNNFWGHIPRFTLHIGNVIDNPELLPSEVVFEPYT